MAEKRVDWNLKNQTKQAISQYHFYFPYIAYSGFGICMKNSVDPDQMTSAQDLLCFKNGVYPGSAGRGSIDY